MTIRRFASLALAAFMLHLNVVRADFACASHGADSRDAAASHHEPSADHAAHDGASTGGHDGQTCDTPSQAECCEALASCSVGLGADFVDATPTSPLARHVMIVALANAPLSRLIAPDPPPPRL